MKNSFKNGKFSSFSGFLKFGQILAPFWDFKFFKYIETKVFLGTLFLDLKGTTFVLVLNLILLSQRPHEKDVFSPWSPKNDA